MNLSQVRNSLLWPCWLYGKWHDRWEDCNQKHRWMFCCNLLIIGREVIIVIWESQDTMQLGTQGSMVHTQWTGLGSGNSSLRTNKLDHHMFWHYSVSSAEKWGPRNRKSLWFLPALIYHGSLTKDQPPFLALLLLSVNW